MGSLGAILKHPDELYPLLKLKMEARNADKQIPQQPHWRFCYSMLLLKTFAFVIEQLPTKLRDSVCILYLVLRALDTVDTMMFISVSNVPFPEDDTGISIDVKVPILKAFHQHVSDKEWHYSCGTKECKVLMIQFHHVSVAFLELGKRYQEVIEDITKSMGAGMVKFICKEDLGERADEDYDEYCHYVSGLIGLGLSKLFHASGAEDLAPDSLSNSMALILQKQDIIKDYFEDINEIPKPRMFWPRQIWGKYVNKLEDLKYEENSVKAVQCLNEMVTNALTHVEDCLTYMSALRDPAIFRFWAIFQVMAIGNLALSYNNVEVFRGVVKMRPGLAAKVRDHTRTMANVYGAFYDFSCMLKSKVDKNDPNATRTLSIIEGLQRFWPPKQKTGFVGALANYGDHVDANASIVESCFIYVCILHFDVYYLDMFEASKHN
ncbi:LOW QUALITY PROTEIN: hypothetical protein BT93_D2084 [Corymbia citriodora subsp. variegata]|nr:LOW QUALITY PROTEIN: hypothetical protein BT93_D2084 [Corymbia citriodora subsp. variegata]